MASLLAATGSLMRSATAVATSAPGKHRASPYASGELPDKARQYYATTWGVDQLSIRITESGALVRFSYRVVDSGKARIIDDRAASPSLVDAVAGVSLSVPTLEKVGPLRQAMSADNGKSYWMAFSNKGGRVKAGHHVSVIVGAFHVDGLVVR